MCVCVLTSVVKFLGHSDTKRQIIPAISINVLLILQEKGIEKDREGEILGNGDEGRKCFI